MDSHDVVSEHRAAGRRLEAAGISSFVQEGGPPGGEPVVCLHCVPASCFLYRKVLRELAARGLRGVAFDLPGLGLADRPAAFDYTWTGPAGSAPPPWTPSDSTGSTWSSTTSAGWPASSSVPR
jgi:pimeloyl-ACP methyl ester carboxylesterase